MSGFVLLLAAYLFHVCRDIDDEADAVHTVAEKITLDDREASQAENIQRSYVHVPSKSFPISC